MNFFYGEEKYLQVNASGKWKWTFGQIQSIESLFLVFEKKSTYQILSER